MKVKKILLSLVMLFLFCTAISGQRALAANSSGQISMQIRHGFDGNTKYGFHIPVRIKITNTGDAWNGKIKLIVPAEHYQSYRGDGGLLPSKKLSLENYVFQKDIEVKARGETYVNMVIPYLTIEQKIRAVLYEEKGKEAAREELEIKEDYTSFILYIGILGEDTEKYHFFNGVGLFDYADMSTRVFGIPYNSYPDNLYGLDMVDVLISDDTRLNYISEKQQKVLLTWLMDGGILLVDSQAADEIETFGISLLEDIKEVGNGCIKRVDLKKLITEIGMDNYEIIADLDRILVEILGEYRVSMIEQKYYYGYTGDFWSQSSLTSVSSIGRIADVGKYAAVLGIYIVLVGPMLYLLLKKAGKRHRFLFCLVLLSLIGSYFIYCIGKETRFEDAFVNYAQILTYEKDWLNDYAVCQVQAPYNSRYEISVKDKYEVIPINESGIQSKGDKELDFSQYHVAVREESGEKTIEIKDKPIFTPEYFTLKSNEELTAGEGVDSNLVYFDGKLEGSITNHLGRDLENAFILMYNRMVYLDLFQDGETKQVDAFQVYTYSNYNQNNMLMKFFDIKNRLEQENGPEEIYKQQKLNMMYYYMQTYYNDCSDKVVLIGFDQKKNCLDYQKESRYPSYGLTMVIDGITVSHEKEGRTYYPFVSEYARALKGDYTAGNHTMNSEELIMQYSLEEQIEEAELVFFTDSQYNAKQVELFEGKVFLYNWETLTYDEIPAGKRIRPDRSDSYISFDSQIKIKYVTEFEETYEEKLLPSLSVIGRKIDA